MQKKENWERGREGEWEGGREKGRECMRPRVQAYKETWN